MIRGGFGVVRGRVVEEFVYGVEAVVVDFKAPLQKPSLHLLNAHWASEEQDAWKLPQTG